jgi:hypothetical protein
VKAEEKRGVDLLEEAERVRAKAWELMNRAEGEGDTRGAVVALREARGCLETLGSLLSTAAGVSLADAKNEQILEEVKRRNLKVPVTQQNVVIHLTEQEKEEARACLRRLQAADEESDRIEREEAAADRLPAEGRRIN